jgi:Helix-turn-helix domain
VDDELAPDFPDGIEVLPVVAVTQTFPARPSSIPEIRDFVRRILAESPLSASSAREVEETVSMALLEAAGPTGTIQVVFRIFPDHTEVDVLRPGPLPAQFGALASAPRPGADSPPAAGRGPADASQPVQSFAEWMATVLRRDGLTYEAAARRLGVSVKTVGRWVGGETEPRLRDLRRIQDVFGQIPLP